MHAEAELAVVTDQPATDGSSEPTRPSGTGVRTRPDLHTAAGSVAQQVQELVALPHRVDQAVGQTAPGRGSSSEIR